MGTKVALLALTFVTFSVVTLHMLGDLDGQRDGTIGRACEHTCEAALGRQACVDRLVRPEALLCHDVVRLGKSTFPITSYSCQCLFEPLLFCGVHNSTTLLTKVETGTCEADKPKLYWALAVIVAGLVGLHGIVSLLCCKGGSSAAGSSIWGLAKAALGSGLAGMPGLAASKAMSLV
jgi:hypothetical protein